MDHRHWRACHRPSPTHAEEVPARSHRRLSNRRYGRRRREPGRIRQQPSPQQPRLCARNGRHDRHALLRGRTPVVAASPIKGQTRLITAGKNRSRYWPCPLRARSTGARRSPAVDKRERQLACGSIDADATIAGTTFASKGSPAKRADGVLKLAGLGTLPDGIALAVEPGGKRMRSWVVRAFQPRRFAAAKPQRFNLPLLKLVGQVDESLTSGQFNPNPYYLSVIWLTYVRRDRAGLNVA